MKKEKCIVNYDCSHTATQVIAISLCQMMAMRTPIHSWLKISFVNLLLIACIGVILRYKIAFSLPFIDQKHLLHGHSHFAFAGWITHTLMVLMIQYLSFENGPDFFKKYRFLLTINLITAYGMLISFPLQGYGIWSISFSTLSICTGYVFAVIFWKDLKRYKNNTPSKLSFQSALIFNTISSIGAFALAYMMATKTVNQNAYLIAVYLFLHFQYNGWFFFSILGLFISKLEGFVFLLKPLKQIVFTMSFACIPAYFLSVLWLPLHIALYWLVVFAAILQFGGWLFFINLLHKNRLLLLSIVPKTGRWLLILAALACTIKLMLQLGSTIPALSQLAFGFRPIVIGYLHLVLLGVVSIFLIGFILAFQLLPIYQSMRWGIRLFVGGILLNEVLLMLQGVAGMDYLIIPQIDNVLLLAALTMFSGILLLNLPFGKKINETALTHKIDKVNT